MSRSLCPCAPTEAGGGPLIIPARVQPGAGGPANAGDTWIHGLSASNPKAVEYCRIFVVVEQGRIISPWN